MEQQAYSQQHVPCINPQQRDNVMHLTFPLPVPATDNMDQERLILAKYEEQRNRVLLVSGVCFLLCLVTLPTIYLFFSDQFDGDSPNIMYIPMVLLVAYPLVIQSILTHLKGKAMEEISQSVTEHMKNLLEESARQNR